MKAICVLNAILVGFGDLNVLGDIAVDEIARVSHVLIIFFAIAYLIVRI